MLHDLSHLQIPLAEKIIRTVAVYAGIAILLRLAGKRDLAQLNTFDLVVMLLLSNVVQNAIIGNDNSLAGGLIGALVLVALNNVVVRLVNRHRRLVRLFEGPEFVIVENGRPRTSTIHRLGLRVADIRLALRRQGATDVSDVARAVLEPSGAITVTLRDGAQPATRADLQKLRTALLDDVRAELRAALTRNATTDTAHPRRNQDDG